MAFSITDVLMLSPPFFTAVVRPHGAKGRRSRPTQIVSVDFLAQPVRLAIKAWPATALELAASVAAWPAEASGGASFVPETVSAFVGLHQCSAMGTGRAYASPASVGLVTCSSSPMAGAVVDVESASEPVVVNIIDPLVIQRMAEDVALLFGSGRHA